MSVAAVFGLAVLVSVGLGLLLYLLVRAETENRPRMDRQQAERVARRDTVETADDRDGDRPSRSDSGTDRGW
jgi:hypothetical protein